ncbi:TspO and MBR related proteins [Halorientalis persicus]|jgi:benzodiazapine receptor|uniref:TspO and MBR related proteins n=1 Tax=Halorientalis persicus TaxID=1367881 RepID=A0A1H8IL49_9EURY|nr:TspO/MBR family protein [Halorientalis persicus]SEN69059.1 TspO and MBR related proteins [Halorientalis persicus]
MADTALSTASRLPERRPIATLVLAILASELVGSLGNLLSLSGVTTWYPTLTTPAFNPPGWVFGPVWITLFALMGTAAWLVWRGGLDDRSVRLALALFGIQFACNVAWSGAFFGLRSPLLGLVVIVALWLAIVATIRAFARVDRRAALLLVPYLLWVSFAAVLNYELWRLN